MGIGYKQWFSKRTLNAAQDIASIVPNAGLLARIVRIVFTDVDTTAPASQSLPLELVTLTGGGQGSGGQVQLPTGNDSLAPSASGLVVGHNADTTPSTGTVSEVGYEGGCFIFQGLDHVLREAMPVNAGNVGVLRCLSAPLAPITVSGFIEFELLKG